MRAHVVNSIDEWLRVVDAEADEGWRLAYALRTGAERWPMRLEFAPQSNFADKVTAKEDAIRQRAAVARPR